MTQAIECEVYAERWTSLDRQIERATAESGGLLDLRPAPVADQASDRILRGRAATLERLGLAERLGPAMWMVDPGAERALRDLADRGAIIQTMPRALQRSEEHTSELQSLMRLSHAVFILKNKQPERRQQTH